VLKKLLEEEMSFLLKEKEMIIAGLLLFRVFLASCPPFIFRA
jgi:hypothetical protein